MAKPTHNDAPDLFTRAPLPDQGEADPNEILGSHGMLARLARLNEETLTAAVFSTTNGPSLINLDLFPEGSEPVGNTSAGPFETVAVITRRTEEGGVSTAYGHLENDPDASLTITMREDVLHLDLFSPADGLFGAVLFAEDTNIYVIRQIDEGKIPDCGVEDGNEAPDEFGDQLEENFSSTATAPKIINLLAVYTSNVREAARGEAAARTRIEQAVTRGNEVLANSLLNIQVRLVGTQELPNYRERPGVRGFYTMLAHLIQGGESGLEGLHELRDASGADIVTLFVVNDALAGLADWTSNVTPSFAPRAYNVTNYIFGSSQWTLIHEMAHNMGCCHTDCSRYKNGFKFNADGRAYKTVMVRMREHGRRIPYFSNPDRQFKRVATGDPRTADHARLIRENIDTVINFRGDPNFGEEA